MTHNALKMKRVNTEVSSSNPTTHSKEKNILCPSYQKYFPIFHLFAPTLDYQRESGVNLRCNQFITPLSLPWLRSLSTSFWWGVLLRQLHKRLHKWQLRPGDVCRLRLASRSSSSMHMHRLWSSSAPARRWTVCNTIWSWGKLTLSWGELWQRGVLQFSITQYFSPSPAFSMYSTWNVKSK